MKASPVETDDDPGVGQKRVVFLKEFDILKTGLCHGLERLKSTMAIPWTLISLCCRKSLMCSLTRFSGDIRPNKNINR